MATNYPAALDDSTTIPVESANTKLSVNHVTAHQNIQDAIEAIEAKVGIDGSAVNTSHDYKLSEVTSTDKAVGKSATQTLTNKTLTSPLINLGSDAEGDTYYRNAAGVLVRLPKGTDNHIMKMNGNVPNWEAETSITDASYSTKGIVQGLTDAATSGLTISSGVISVNSGTGANQIVKLDGSSKLPAVDGSALTNVIKFESGTTTKNLADSSTTQTIAHGLGRTPKYVRITAWYSSVPTSGSDPGLFQAFAVYNGTTQSAMSNNKTSNTTSAVSANFRIGSGNTSASDYQGGVITVDSTNITITWTKAGSAGGTATLLWEAQG